MSRCALEAKRIVKHLYNSEVVTIERLKSYEGYNFLCQVRPEIYERNSHSSDCSVVLKFLPSKETVCQIQQCQLDVIRFLQCKGFPCPKPVLSRNGKVIEKLPKEYRMQEYDKDDSDTLLPGDEFFMVTLLRYIPGDMLSSLHPVPGHLFHEAGETLATFHEITKNYDGDLQPLREYSHQSQWSLEQLPQLVNFLWVLQDDWLKSVVPKIVHQFEEKVLPRLSELPKGVIHGDFNDDNIIILRSLSEQQEKPNGQSVETDVSISGIVDFGDTSFSCLVFDIAIALSFMVITDVPNIMEAARLFIKGYTSKRKLLQSEKDVLFTSVIARLAQNIVLALQDYRIDPSNAYLLASMDDYPVALKKLLSCTEHEIRTQWQL